ncbi:MAG TPA: TIR domain-containing protein [Blastocatellia bacterium]|nr:TIR domain-containing protein [Blastocatellia bacterium]
MPEPLQVTQILSHLPDSFNCVAFAPDGRTLATAGADGTVKLWDVTTRQLLHDFEGHRDWVRSVAFAPDGRTLTSTSADGTVIVWDVETGAMLQEERWEHPSWKPLAVTYERLIGNVLGFGKTPYGHDDIIVRSICLNADAPAKSFTRYVSAKVVLVGESEVGKSCLASRIAQDKYVELGSTHGMKLWQMKPEQLDPNAVAPDGEQRDITIWDLGGQDEYRLVHQLFLHDTTLALMLFSPDRGAKALEDVREWNLRLEKQKRSATTKLLIGTKADAINPETIDHNGINALLGECCIAQDWHLVSAKVGTNIAELKTAISQANDWPALSTTTRPLLFHLVREAITERQQRCEVVVLYSELEQQIRNSTLPDGEPFDPGAVRTVVDQLERQGVIVDTFLSSGERALVLQIGYIEIYASSLILIAKHNPRGVPALELAELDGMKSYPGIKPAERLHLFQERIVIECVVQLLLQHGLCLKHEGLLIFPALFPSLETKESDGTETVSLYYDFTGAIDNIYSSLVVKLAHSEHFGRVRLSGNRADYDQCGLRKVERRSGWAHLDLVFSDKVAKATRDLFTVFVEEHLEKEGVTIKEVLAMKCGNCSETIEEDKVRSRIELGQTDIVCWKCDTRLPIHEGAKKARAGSEKLHHELLALRTKIEAKKDRDISEARRALDSVEVFFSYSHKDDELRHELVKHLSTLRRRGVISNWHDRLIGAGDEWAKEIDSHLESARIILLLISPDFIASDYCWDKEMMRAIERHKAGEARVIPIALRPTNWSGAPFSELQALPTDRKHVTTWTNRDEAFVNIAEGIEKAVEALLRPDTQTEAAGAADIVAPVIALQTPTRILHLSDLHFGTDDDVDVRLYQLSRDLKDKTDGLGFDTLDYLVISGDLTNRATKEEFDHAYEFISGLIERFKLSAERCIIVPGNHDLSWDHEVYDWKQERLVDPKTLQAGQFVKEGKMYGIRDEAKYPGRFDNFSKFHHSLIQLPYPLRPEEQGVPFLYDEPRIQFLTMNSAWEIDEWHKDRSSVNDKALARMLTKADEQILTAKKMGRMQEDANVLRLAVWHHPVTGNEKIINDAFLEQLRKADVKLCLHGHVHEDRADLIGYLHPTRKLHIAGAGSFGAGAKERPPAIPRLYNVLEIWRDHSKIRVHTRCLKKEGGAWDGWAVWPGQDNLSKRSFYEINLK